MAACQTTRRRKREKPIPTKGAAASHIASSHVRFPTEERDGKFGTDPAPRGVLGYLAKR